MKTTKICPVCGNEFTRIHTRNKMPTYCSRACANKSPNRMTDEIKEKIGDSCRGENHWNYKGGWIQHNKNRDYYFMLCDKQFPTKRGSYILRSHYVWNINNPNNLIYPGEVMHHKNNDSMDDGIENLEKISSQSEHASKHQKVLASIRKRDDKGRFI